MLIKILNFLYQLRIFKALMNINFLNHLFMINNILKCLINLFIIIITTRVVGLKINYFQIISKINFDSKCY